MAQSTLERIAKLARNLCKRAESSISHPLPTQSHPTLIISLPEPPDLKDEFIELGCNASAAAKVSELLRNSGHQLKRITEAKSQRALEALPQEHLQAKLVAVVTSRYLAILDGWVTELKDRLRARLLAISRQISKRHFISHDPDGRLRRTRKNKRTTFNHAYVALLEHFFSEHPYPTTHDKTWLAQRTGMTTKQISVWYQNRRNRSPKDSDYKGRRVIVRKKVTLEDVKKEAPEIIKPTAGEMRDEHAEFHEVHSSEEDYPEPDMMTPQISITAPNPFHYAAPNYAFPTRYPPAFEDGHVKDARGSFPKPTWARCPCSSTPSIPALDVDELNILFAHLRTYPKPCELTRMRKKNLPCVSDISKNVKGTSSRLRTDHAAARIAITTIVQKAPLAAFIPQKLVPLVLMAQSRKRRANQDQPSDQSWVRPIAPLPKRGSSEFLRIGASRDSEGSPVDPANPAPRYGLPLSPQSSPRTVATSPARPTAPLPRRKRVALSSPTAADGPHHQHPASFGTSTCSIDSSEAAPRKRMRTTAAYQALTEPFSYHARSSSSPSLYLSDGTNTSDESLLATPPSPVSYPVPPLSPVLHLESDLHDVLVVSETGCAPFGDMYGMHGILPLALLSSVAAESPKVTSPSWSSLNSQLCTHSMSSLS
ncbi:hypothetical protein PUNSTDRAFT_123737 [Punctularia strigosozonata HHB-11173 SS5]|uniref:uncharacterized protein n=1 Tax=Punctularia strigosozonata (strain HHB-11173) TaxID=741275 RepID=UPI000441766D|nr:uncharacterized protein PUNSTDRAFT_123737 [Punctularia strigosozonata HHB-11173 SS5]EIN13980.1 hypothetical protein PUNSTDRAFT_123737 [Punctularia strigosozonata HHB-11173 SS5]